MRKNLATIFKNCLLQDNFDKIHKIPLSERVELLFSLENLFDITYNLYHDSSNTVHLLANLFTEEEAKDIFQDSNIYDKLDSKAKTILQLSLPSKILIDDYLSCSSAIYLLTNLKEKRFNNREINLMNQKIITIPVTLTSYDIYTNFLTYNFITTTTNETLKKEAIQNIPDNSIDNFLYTYSRYLNEDTLKQIIIEKINEDNILPILSVMSDEKVYDIILQTHQSILDAALEWLPTSLSFGVITSPALNSFKQYVFTKKESKIKNYIETKAQATKKIQALYSNDTISEAKQMICNSYNIKYEDLNTYLNLGYFLQEDEKILLADSFNEMLSFINTTKLSIEDLIQYEIGNTDYNWLIDIYTIINKNPSEFNQVKDFFFTYYYQNENSAKYIKVENYLNIMRAYTRYPNLCKNIIDSYDTLDEKQISDISFILNSTTKIIPAPNNLEDLNISRALIIEEYKNKLNNPSLTLDEAKKIMTNLLFHGIDIKQKLKTYGGSSSIKLLQLRHSNSPSFQQKAEELITYTSLMEEIVYTSSLTSIKKTISKVLENNAEFANKISSAFSLYESKFRNLYELDAMLSLTKLSEAKKIEGIYTEDQHGGTYDFRDTNYILYAHKVSPYEDIEDLLQRKSNADMNFISLSAVSYQGQRYYGGGRGIKLACDTLDEGAYICSSTKNMGSNYKLKKHAIKTTELGQIQRGILETSRISAIRDENSETLAMRESIYFSGIIIPNNRNISEEEILLHEQYNLPYILTQNINEVIKNPTKLINTSQVQDITINSNDQYSTGKRKIAIFTDPHGLVEPTLAVLQDIQKKGITEIYSLGDNIGTGPNSGEVIDLLNHYGVKSVSGNSEYYITMGIEPFKSYFNDIKIKNQKWTEEHLTERQIGIIKTYPASISLILGGQKIALCHFANDVRYDFEGVWTYQANEQGIQENTAWHQFERTNSQEEQELLTRRKNASDDQQEIKALQTILDNPLFEKKQVTAFDYIFEGHTHFRIIETPKDGPNIYTLRAVGMGYNNDPSETASYTILEEQDSGFTIEEVLVPYNRESLRESIDNTDMPYIDRLISYTNFNPNDFTRSK